MAIPCAWQVDRVERKWSLFHCLDSQVSRERPPRWASQSKGSKTAGIVVKCTVDPRKLRLATTALDLTRNRFETATSQTTLRVPDAHSLRRAQDSRVVTRPVTAAPVADLGADCDRVAFTRGGQWSERMLARCANLFKFDPSTCHDGWCAALFNSDGRRYRGVH